MSQARGRFAAALLGAAGLVAALGACSEPAPTVARVADAPATAASPAPAATSTEPAATPEVTPSTTTTTAPTPTPAPTSVPPPPRSTSPARGSTPRATPSPTVKPPTTPPPPAPAGTDAYESQILALVNAQRSAAGFRPLTAHACADGFAEPWSPHMAAEGRLSHQSLGPVLSRCGARTAAENVGMNSSASPADMVAGFMSSPPHRANILNAAYTGIGVGAYRDARGVWWVTQDFVG